MESSIIMMEHTDQATKQMLQNLVNRKLKFDRYKKYHILGLWISVLYSFMSLYLLYYHIILPYSYSFFDIFTLLLGDNQHIFFVLLAFGIYGATKLLYEKRQKFDKEYHELRCEIIDRSKDLWKDEAWKVRHNIFHLMKQQYDINLYHESK